jgi:ABC-2 type transport system ATP-binding protein
LAALLHDPPLLVLDEPLSGIDPVGRREMVALFRGLAARGKCLLVSSHELEELEKLTEHVAILARGRIAAVGTLAQIRDLLDHQPLAIRIDSDEPRRLARELIALDEVLGVEAGDGEQVVVRARNQAAFFRRLARLVIEKDLDVRHLETLDDSLHALLEYLLGGRRA